MKNLRKFYKNNFLSCNSNFFRTFASYWKKFILTMKYTEYKGLNLSEIGKEMKQYWEEHQIFDKSMSTREGHPQSCVR